MGANISTLSGSDGSTVKLDCSKGHIMEGSKIKYGKFDNIALYKDYNLPKKCINKKECSFKINKNSIKHDPAPGVDKQFEITLACFDPPYIPGLKTILKKNIYGKNHWNEKKMVEKTVNINGETRVIKVQAEESKPIVIISPVKVNKPVKTVKLFTNKYILLGIVTIVILWFLILRNYKILKGGAKLNV